MRTKHVPPAIVGRKKEEQISQKIVVSWHRRARDLQARIERLHLVAPLYVKDVAQLAQDLNVIVQEANDLRIGMLYVVESSEAAR